jgi:DNA-binding response OmpR family regulator
MEQENNKYTIMIIEDDVFVMDIYQTKLSQEGFQLISAVNGVEAVKKLETETPDLILLDIIMPLMGGLETLAEIKKNERVNKVPIIMLTNLSQKEEVNTAMGLGANDFLIKSHFTPSEVLEKIKKILEKK